MPQDAFHIRRLVEELNVLLVGGKINRISQVNKDELTLIVYTGTSTVKLIVSAHASGARVCLSATEKEPAPVAPNFCMLLRKHIQGAEILAVRQPNFERIVEIDLHCTTDFSQSTRTLHCELMGKYSNVILTERGRILGALKTTALLDDTHRVLLSGANYVYPAPQDKLSYLDGAGLCSRLISHLETRENLDEESFAVWLFENVAGLALATTREFVRRVKAREGGLPTALDPAAQPPEKPLAFCAFLKEFCEDEPNRPCLKIEGGKAADFFAFSVEGGAPFPSLCKAEDEFFTRREEGRAFEDKKRKLENALLSTQKKQLKKRQETLERLREAEKAEDYRVRGELLTANLYRIERGETSVELDNWYAEGGGKVKISLDVTLSPAQNAQRLFKQYNKYKRAREVLTPMLEREDEEISYTRSVLFSVRTAESADDLAEIQTEMTEIGLLRKPQSRVGGKKKEKEIPFRRYLFQGYEILVGRNNVQNDRLLKEAAPYDVWLHAQKYHSSHVIVRARGGQVCDEVLLFAAELCAYYSDGRESDKIPVDYCLRKFVKKPKGGKAGFVVYTDYKTLLACPTFYPQTPALPTKEARAR